MKKYLSLFFGSVCFLTLFAPAVYSADPYSNSLPVSYIDYGTGEKVAEENVLASPEQVYKTSCLACHAAGVLGAPKLGSKEDWAPRIGVGIDGLVASAIKGKNAMPPRGGSTVDDATLKATIEWMLGQSQ